MRIIKKRTLQNFWLKHRDCEDFLKEWLSDMKHHSFQTPNDIKARYRSADIIAGNQIIFNIKGNHYRLIVKYNYGNQIGYIRFIGKHTDYDKIDAEKV